MVRKAFCHESIFLIIIALSHSKETFTSTFPNNSTKPNRKHLLAWIKL